MQAVFEARLMDYSEECRQNSEQIILPAFLKGYNSERPFSALQKSLMPYLYAIIDSFWDAYTLWGKAVFKLRQITMTKRRSGTVSMAFLSVFLR